MKKCSKTQPHAYVVSNISSGNTPNPLKSGRKQQEGKVRWRFDKGMGGMSGGQVMIVQAREERKGKSIRNGWKGRKRRVWIDGFPRTATLGAAPQFPYLLRYSPLLAARLEYLSSSS